MSFELSSDLEKKPSNEVQYNQTQQSVWVCVWVVVCVWVCVCGVCVGVCVYGCVCEGVSGSGSQ